MEWRKIEIAPKDKKGLLLVDKDGCIWIGSWNEKNNCWICEASEALIDIPLGNLEIYYDSNEDYKLNIEVDAEYWMEIPEPPSSEYELDYAIKI